jgi:hypothetical protein
MYLIKFIDSQWKNAAIRGTSIRIGSVKYYRNHEDSSIRDEDEGEGRISLRLKTIDGDTFNRIMSNEEIRLVNGWTIDANGTPILSERHPFNTLVFSCACAESLTDVVKLKKIFGRSELYYIRDPMYFAYATAEAIRKRLHDWILNNLNKISANAHHKIGRLRVHPVVGRVLYTDRPKDIVVEECNVATFDPRTFSIDSYFSKPLRFQMENEVRIIWTASFGEIDDSDVDFISIPLEYIDISLLRPRFTALPKAIKETRLVNHFGKKISLTKRYADG